MSTVKSNTLQLGQSLTATNNFVLYQPSSPDGTVRLGNGNAGSVTDLVTVNSSGNVGIGTSSPVSQLNVNASTGGDFRLTRTSVGGGSSTLGSVSFGNQSSSSLSSILATEGGTTTSSILAFYTATGGTSSERMRLDSSGNLGLGVTPSVMTTLNAMQLGGTAIIAGQQSSVEALYFGSNWYYNSGFKYKQNGYATYCLQNAGTHVWYNAPSGTAGNAISFTQAMTLDASGNLQLGTTSSSGKTLTLKGTSSSGALSVVFNASSAVMVEFNGSSTINGVDGTPNGNGLMRIWRDSGNLRSISAAGTLNASGADYAEYMTKAGDFEIAKGDVCGVDSSGLLTNVFADAVSFVVKSTDPSYVGNDSWGANIDDKDVLEVARQKVDRIAFAGQVPVNVFGATPGDYVIPIEDSGSIKGEAVSSPTFEQYQIAVGKVIAIESDGRARIIVKVA